MSLLKHSPLHRKLTWLAMSCSIVALAVTAISLGTYEWFFYRRSAFTQLETLSLVAARNSSAALAFDNEEDAERILKSLETEPSIRAAGVYDNQGELFAWYTRDANPRRLPRRAPNDGRQVINGQLQIVVPIAETKRFGTLLVLADTGAVIERLTVYLAVLAVTTTMSGLIALLLSARLKKRITGPVQALAQAASAVQTSEDYRLQVPKQENDELGTLTDAFNQMLQRIQLNQFELNRSEERLRLALDAAKVGTWDWDLKADLVRWDERNYEIFEVPKSTPIHSRVFMDQIHEDDAARVRATIDAAAKSVGYFATEFRLRAKPGGLARYVAARGVFVADGGGPPARAVGVTMDISERRRSEIRVAESEQRFRIVAEKAPAMIWSADVFLKRDYFNRTWLAFTGRSLESELGEGWRASIHPDDVDRWTRFSQLAAVVNDPYSLEYRLRRFDGVYRWIMESASPRLAADGSFAGFLGSCIDITSRKANEEELEEHVRVRTAQLEAANRELESFSYSVSHDLRSPVRLIQGFGEIALEEAQAAKLLPAVEPLQRLLAATRRMDELISAFIALARIGRSELRMEELDLTKMAEETLQALRATAPARTVAVEIQAGLRAWGDERLIRIVLENLLGNAWKFTAGKIDPRIQMGTTNEAGKNAFFVRDNGAGFNAAFSNKLFQAFQRLHSTAQFEGLGVGLNTVSRAILRHGGEVWATGVEGEGATFFFTLPPALTDRALTLAHAYSVNPFAKRG